MLKFPQHKASLHLTHNGHKANYLTVEQAIAEGDFGCTDDCWVSEEQKQKAIAADDFWTLQWYPETPVGFCVLSACDLDALLEASSGDK